jgi:hypothetical protein
MKTRIKNCLYISKLDQNAAFAGAHYCNGQFNQNEYAKNDHDRDDNSFDDFDTKLNGVLVNWSRHKFEGLSFRIEFVTLTEEVAKLRFAWEYKHFAFGALLFMLDSWGLTQE